MTDRGHEVDSRAVEIVALAGVVMAAMLLALAWTRIVPIFEAPDEPVHFDYALTLAHAGRLLTSREGPVGLADPDSVYLFQRVEVERISFHPLQRVAAGYGTPQYYRDVDAHAPAVDAGTFRRPHAVPYVVSVYPFLFYALEALVIRAVAPFTGLTGEFFAARAFCALLAGVATVFAYFTLRELRFRADRALLITAIIGLWPLATFVGSYVQPDNLSFALVSAVLWATVRFKRDPADRRGVPLIGVLLGLLAITKPHVFVAVFVPVAALCLSSALRLPVAERRSRRAVLWLCLPALATLALQYGYIAPFWVHAESVTVERMRNEALAHAYARDGLAGALPLLTGTAGRALNDFFGTNGKTAMSFWGDFGWLDTPLIIAGPRVEALVRTGIHVLSVVCIAGAAFAVAGYVRDTVSIALRGRPRSALRLLFADPLTSSYLLFGAALFGLYVVTDDGFGAQGRNWIPFSLPIVLIAVDVAPRALATFRLAAPAAIVMTALLALYAAVGTHAALATVGDRYYRGGEVVPDGAWVGAQWDGTTTLGVIDEVRDDASPGRLRTHDPIAVRGWAVDAHHLTVARAVWLEIDGDRIVPARYGSTRPDVADALRPSYADSGFDATLRPGTLAPGTHRLQLCVVTADLAFYERLADQRTLVVAP